MINEVLDSLVGLGITPQKVSSNILRFETEGLQFLFQGDLAEDPSYYRLMLPDIDSDLDNMHSIYEKAVKISSSYKLGKCIIIEGKVWLTVEGFAFDAKSVTFLLARLITVLKDMINAYRHYGTDKNESEQKES